MTSRVYLVYTGEYDDRELIGAFLDSEQATLMAEARDEYSYVVPFPLHVPENDETE